MCYAFKVCTLLLEPFIKNLNFLASSILQDCHFTRVGSHCSTESALVVTYYCFTDSLEIILRDFELIFFYFYTFASMRSHGNFIWFGP